MILLLNIIRFYLNKNFSWYIIKKLRKKTS